MKTRIILLALLSFLSVVLMAKHSDHFMIGNYSYWRTYGIHQAAADSVLQRMKDCGYNASIINVYNENETAIRSMLEKFDSYEQDAILTDYTWDALQTSGKYGVHGFTTANYQRYEAEYANEFDVHLDDHKKDRYYYSSRISDLTDTLRVGDVVESFNKSNGYIWQCINGTHQPGYAYKNLTYRWKKEGNNSFESLTEELQFIKMAWDITLTDYMMSNTFIDFTFALRLPSYDRDVANPINLLKFELCGYTWNNQFKKIPHVNYEAEENGYETILTQYDYERINRTDDYGNKLVTLRVNLLTLRNLGFLSSDDAFPGRYVISDINPRMYWYGNSILELDYVEVQDNIHKFMEENTSSFVQGLNQRISQLTGWSPGNIKYMYGFDEPNQAQFDSYRRVQSAISGENPQIITAIYDWRRDMLKSPTSGNQLQKYYHHQRAFIDRVNPKILSPDLYPIRDSINWNQRTDPMFIQIRLENNLLVKYKDYKTSCIDNPNMRFIPIVQSFGSWTVDTGGQYEWKPWLRPPKETQKMLQLLPLCYGADGVINFLFPTWNTSIGAVNYYGALSIIDAGGSNFSYVPHSNFYALQEANSKISTYASYLNNCSWVGVDSLRINNGQNDLPLSSLMMNGISILPSEGRYQGYVQCGAFLNGNQPYFMLVNRRANYVKTGYNPVTSNNESLDSCFEPALSQMLRFNPSADAYTHFGTSIALLDPYDDVLYLTSNQCIDVEIGPGDGLLVEIVGTLPNSVTTNSQLSTKAILEGSITIEPGIIVDVSSGTSTRIKKHSVIQINSGSSFTLRGEVTVEDSVRFSVAPNGTLIFDNVNCTWGRDAIVEITGGSLSITGGDCDTTSVLWKGIIADSGSTIEISNTWIKNAKQISVVNSNLSLFNSRIDVPPNCYGLLLQNNSPGYLVEVINTEAGKGFYGTSSDNAIGIALGHTMSPLLIRNVDFHDLKRGIFKTSSNAVSDSIIACRFINCHTGIRALSSVYNAIIIQCTFQNNLNGIWLAAADPYISNCLFTNCSKGVFIEFTLLSAFRSGIHNSTFYNCDIGIDSRNSSAFVRGNYFNRNVTGILSHAASNLNLGNEAFNRFRNHQYNIQFYDNDPYEAGIQIAKGHNDFYHLYNDQTGYMAYDFSFDDNYQYNLLGRPIMADLNWFESHRIRVYPEQYGNYVYADLLDDEPNTPSPPPDIDRFYMALENENIGNYDIALGIYESILDDQFESEKEYFSSCADGVYRLSQYLHKPPSEMESYFNDKIAQYQITDPYLFQMLSDYMIKLYVSWKEYQSAIDMIQARIDYPINEIDSLLAVLDLEIVLQLSALEENKKPVFTTYVQYNYPSVDLFMEKHEEHWDLLNEMVMNRSNSPSIPPVPMISKIYPNPFNPSTTIVFSVPSLGKANLSIYNLRGQLVKVLLDSDVPKGQYRIVWNGDDKNNRKVASGLYIARISASGKTSSRKMMLIK